ncbi:hypothetical protein DEU56DRAFT_754118 [Suillus clintonianus]|uniref:uncharacterized protein n=1 Tax=Suillus clintonianus TaxID=1904413 RepID=UPI001B8742F2|nr:uncharacterized protein DEU56DRAFT_754118 [Suillus clintonianus]KAG2145261.1 hypothetical protein DEU56DRAFT_754118 [Suillus clintonianus]
MVGQEHIPQIPKSKALVPGNMVGQEHNPQIPKLGAPVPGDMVGQEELKKVNHNRFSFNFINGVGRTDGEALEHGWADIYPLATSTCAILLRKYKTTVPEVEECAHDLDKFEAALDADQLAGWGTDIEMWELDHSLPNPFKVKTGAMVTQAAMHLALLKTKAKEIERGIELEGQHEVIELMAQLGSTRSLRDKKCAKHRASQYMIDDGKLSCLRGGTAVRARDRVECVTQEEANNSQSSNTMKKDIGVAM